MFEKIDDRWSDTEKLLWLIYNELRTGKTNDLTVQNINKDNSITKPKEQLKTNSEGKQKEYKCKTCGEVYTNMGKLLSCAKKHKKGE